MKVVNGAAHFYWSHPSRGMMETITPASNAPNIEKLLGKKSKHWKLDEKGVKVPKVLNKKWTVTDPETGITTSGGDDNEYEELDTPLYVLMVQSDEAEEI